MKMKYDSKNFCFGIEKEWKMIFENVLEPSLQCMFGSYKNAPFFCLDNRKLC